MREPIYDCEQAIARLAAFVDRELSDGEAHLVQAHLDYCEGCRHAFLFEHSILHFIGEAVNEESLPAGLEDSIFAALKK